MRVVLPTGQGCVLHLFVVHRCQGAEQDLERLAFSNRLLNVVLAEALAVCVGQPMVCW